MFRLFNNVGSAARGAATGLVGCKLLQLAGATSSTSLSNIVQMNALGNFSLSIALGTTLEVSSLLWLGFSGFRNATSENQSVQLKATNILLGTAGFTTRQLLGASIGYALFALNGSAHTSLSTYLSSVALGSVLFAGGVTLGAQALTHLGSSTGGFFLNLAADNMASVSADLESKHTGPRYK